METATGYRFPRFHRELLYHDLAFEGGRAPGEPFPDFDLPTVDGGSIAKRDVLGTRPTLVVFASFT